MFQQPAEGDRLDLKTVIGALALIYAYEHRQNVTTANGVKDAIVCDIHILDGDRASEVFKNVMLFGGVLIGSLRSAIGGDPVLGRIGQGTAKPGQNPAWILIPFTQQDAAVATAYIQRMAPGFQPPAEPATAAQYVPQQQPAAAAPPVPQPAAAYPAAATPYPAAASPATGSYQPAPAQQYAPAPAAAPAPAYQPAPPAAAPPQSEADKFLGYPIEVQLVLIQSGQAPALTQDQFATLPGDIQQALLKLQAAAV